MGNVGRHERERSALRVAAVVGALAIVAGCSGASLPSLSGSLPTWFSSTPAAPVAGGPVPGALDTSSIVTDDCPSVDVRTGAGTLAIAGKSAQPTANDLRYQLTFVEMARQCFLENGTMRIRVGVQGRAVVGPAGAPSQIIAPIRYAVVHEGVQPKTIATKVRRVPVPLATGNVVFTDIEDDLSFPMPPLAVLQSYTVYVGYDEAAEQPKQTKQPKKKAAKKPPPSVAPGQ